jgi:hypothetical protein
MISFLRSETAVSNPITAKTTSEYSGAWSEPLLYTPKRARKFWNPVSSFDITFLNVVLKGPHISFAP